MGDRNVDFRFTDGSEINNRFAADIYGPRDSQWESIPMSSLSAVFVSEAMAILRCAQLLVFKKVSRRRIHTCSDRAATAKLAKTTIESAFVCERMQAVEKISGRNKITLVWIPGNEEAENFVKEETNKFPVD
jgi:hypothetical protein